MLKVGDLELEVIKPEDLDRQLVAATGCSARETREHLTNAAIADLVGAALIPFVKDAPSRPMLAQAIAAAGVVHVRAEVQKLYDGHLGIEPEPMPEHLQRAYEADAARRAADAAAEQPAAAPRKKKGGGHAKAKG